MSEYIVDRENIFPYGSQREEIVRCRDCEHYKPWVLSRPENGGDCYLNKNEVDVTHDGFCAWAERRSE